MNALFGARANPLKGKIQAITRQFLSLPQVQLMVFAAGALCLVEIGLIFGSYAVFGPV